MEKWEKLMKTLPAIIIARGGSKRTPRKNVRDFCGRPLVEWSIIQAQASEACFPVVLSTDDDEIAQIGFKRGVLVLRRPVMPDNTSGAVAFNIAFGQLYDLGYEFDSFVSLMATGPLRLPGDLDKAIELYWTKAYPKRTVVVAGNYVSYSVAIPGKKTGKLPGDEHMYTHDIKGGNMTLVLDNGLLSVHNIKSYRKATQPLDYDKRAVSKARRLARRLYPYMYFYMCQPWQYTDIDYPEEFEFAEVLFKHFILDRGHYQ